MRPRSRIKVATAKQTEQATAPIKINTAVQSEVQKAAAPCAERSRTSCSKEAAAGNQYIRAEDATGESGKMVRQEAAKAGIPVFNKEDVSSLQNVDAVKANLDSIMKIYQGKLAADRDGPFLYAAPKNTLEKLAQADPDLAAIGKTQFPAAISALRGVAGAGGGNEFLALRSPRLIKRSRCCQ